MDVPTKKKEKKPRCYFTKEEDEQVIELHKQYGGDWAKIASILQTKNPRQCRDRYVLYLSNERNTKPFTEEEIARLQKLVEKYGHKWRMLSCAFDRSEIQLKNLWKIICRRQQRARRRAEKEEEILQASREIDEQIANQKKIQQTPEEPLNHMLNVDQVSMAEIMMANDKFNIPPFPAVRPVIPSVPQLTPPNLPPVIIPAKLESEAIPQMPITDFMKQISGRTRKI